MDHHAQPVLNLNKIGIELTKQGSEQRLIFEAELNLRAADFAVWDGIRRDRRIFYT